MDYKTCNINIDISKQSPDIAMGVDVGGAGDQGIMFGYACDETENYMPYAIDMAHKLSKKVSDVRKAKEIPYLRPDAKTQVTVEYDGETPVRVDAIVVSTQHAEEVTQEQIRLFEDNIAVFCPAAQRFPDIPRANHRRDPLSRAAEVPRHLCQRSRIPAY